MDEIVDRYCEAQARFEELDGYALDARAREVLAGLSFSSEMMDGDVGNLSGGWKMRVALARILLMRPDAMLFVSHDRHFLAALSNRVLELTPDGIHQYGGGYTEYVVRTGQEAPGLHSESNAFSTIYYRRPCRCFAASRMQDTSCEAAADRARSLRVTMPTDSGSCGNRTGRIASSPLSRSCLTTESGRAAMAF